MKRSDVLGSSHAKTNRKMNEVERMTACGLDESEIAYCMGIDVVTLKHHYQDQLDMGQARVMAKIGMSQIRQAIRGDSNAAQFFLRARGRWVTPTKIEQDVTLTVEDKRSLMDHIVGMVAKAREPVTIEQPAQVKKLERATAPAGSKPS